MPIDRWWVSQRGTFTLFIEDMLVFFYTIFFCLFLHKKTKIWILDRKKQSMTRCMHVSSVHWLVFVPLACVLCILSRVHCCGRRWEGEVAGLCALLVLIVVSFFRVAKTVVDGRNLKERHGRYSCASLSSFLSLLFGLPLPYACGRIVDLLGEVVNMAVRIRCTRRHVPEVGGVCGGCCCRKGLSNWWSGGCCCSGSNVLFWFVRVSLVVNEE